MPFVTIDNTRLYYRLEGKTGQPTLVLSHSVGTDHGMWAPQMEDLLPHFQILRYDTRGHGASDAPAGDYSLELLGRDVLGITRALGISKFAFCGLSLGGAIGQWLAIHAPENLTALILANTSPQFGARSNWDERIKRVSEGGMASIASLALGRFFSAETLAANGPEVNAIRSVFLGTSPTGYIACCATLRDADNTASLRNINVPTLVIAGDRDVSTPWQGHSEVLAREIPRARAVHLTAAHLSNQERPRSYSTALL